MPPSYIKTGLLELCKIKETYSNTFGPFIQDDTELTEDKTRLVIKLLSQLIVEPADTIAVTRCFPQIVLQLLTLSQKLGENKQEKNEFLALGKLVSFHPDARRFAIRYLEKTTCLLLKHPKKFKDPELGEYQVKILRSCLNFVHTSSEHYRHSKSWSPLLGAFLQSKNPEVKWLTCQCIASITGMSNYQRQKFVEKQLTGQDFSQIMLNNDDFHIAPPQQVIAVSDAMNMSTLPVHSQTVVSVGGIQLPVFDEAKVKESWFLAADEFNLVCLALAVANGKAVCLKGPVGCGKTALVEHLAKLTGREAPHFLKVQLGDQTDSKMLLGTYQCTDVPGEFVWTPGVLTQAVVHGHWLLLEDIDSAAIDVATILTALLETGYLTVPGYRDSVKVSPNFQLFLTQRLLGGAHRQQSPGSTLLEKHWVQINLDPLNYQQMVVLVETLFKPLKSVSTRMVDVFWVMKESTELTGNVRQPSTRDLIKWCERNVQSFDVASRESTLKIFQDALDIYCSNINNSDTKQKLAIRTAGCLGLTEAQAEYYCSTYKPNITKSNTTFVTGRVQTDILAETNFWRLKSNFSFTRPSSCLLESVACCVKYREPVLLVGETGTGKTSTVQYLAECSGHRLVVINMNQQSDSADLLGGFKPVDIKYIVHPLIQDFELLLRQTLSMSQIARTISSFGTLFNQRRWQALTQLFKQIQTVVLKKVGSEEPVKLELKAKWVAMGEELVKLDMKLKNSSAMAFAFIEGSLVQALREGWWVLLDEINLASAETLECLSGLLEGSAGSLHMLERGDKEAVTRHQQFRLFACMNPATDVGKKELPVGLRNRFTEFYVDELTQHLDLMHLVGTYLRGLSLPDTKLDNLVNFYLDIRKDAKEKFSDGVGQKPHYSLRTLCRALSIAAKNKCGSTPRSLYEALCVSFLTQLDNLSHRLVEGMISRAILNKKTAKSILNNPIPEPKSSQIHRFENFEGYWIPVGSLDPTTPDKYILTPTVHRNLRDLARVVSIGRLPVLIQGETSVGKTSLITYLAKASGNRCVRINNHEHTDLQEYVGSYSANEQGRLVFKEGVLVEAMRKGDWIILDELNLAPSDVLEALNRVLDDNRELFIPETRETVKAHSQFMLFATQNPPGLYGGRKMLSRAFRNRFVELHFNEIPHEELETILHMRCDLPPWYCRRMVSVMNDLQIRRKGSSAFAGKQGFITLRDLFRWGERYRLANENLYSKAYDWDQHIADEGYLVLAGRVRKREEMELIREVLQKHIHRQVDPEKLFTLSKETSPVTRPLLENLLNKPHPDFGHIVWTFNMRRLAVLVAKALDFKEPVLLVGETGCGKTTICQLLAAMQRQHLFCVNCHMHTESSDFLGGLRPVRDHTIMAEGTHRLFEWVDGPLIKAMQYGDLFLADEISLADDSVLERLNSLLEPERTLLLSEKGGDELTNTSFVVKASDNFHFIGTMNPGGDFGKKELSPALRNRFTEIWCEACTDPKDLLLVIEHNLRSGLSLRNQEDGTSGIGHGLLNFLKWFTSTDIGKRVTVSIRDILSWVNFINVCTVDPKRALQGKLELPESYIHGAFLTFLDSLGSGVTSCDSVLSLKNVRNAALHFLTTQTDGDIDSLSRVSQVVVTDTSFGIHPFYIDRGPEPVKPNAFTFSAPTTGLNACRVLRGMQLVKPILLEGSPGVGKTALVEALAKASGHRLVRINLSDQTDVCDLFGADLPVEGGEGGQFAWRDGPFLQALKGGHWILIDELNLASQSVLEGLNACLDHRGEVFIPELGRTFKVTPGTRLFGAQNPLKQGGARRGLPKSFLNRFTQVYIDALSDFDLEFITVSLFPDIPREILSLMVRFNSRLVRETSELRLWGYRGSPWEFNLRDMCRWCQAMIATSDRPDHIQGRRRPSAEPAAVEGNEATDLGGDFSEGMDRSRQLNPGRFLDLIYVDRMRTKEDKEKVKEIYRDIFGAKYPLCSDFPNVHITPDSVYIGDVTLRRNQRLIEPCSGEQFEDYGQFVSVDNELLLLRSQCRTLQSLGRCVAMNWLSIIVGPADSGKTSVVRLLAQLAGRPLKVLSVNSAMDTTEILGGFEQVDYTRHLEDLSVRLERVLLDAVRRLLVASSGRRDGEEVAQQLLAQWETFRQVHGAVSEAHQHALENFSRVSQTLRDILCYLKSHSSLVGELAVLDELTADLDLLEGKVAQAGSLNAGGKFQWCDSILVKCLVEGSWLLVDNVNLCSPAVLDRLNALLEPGGVLTVGERGVGPDGEQITYRPHPAFRLFMALDPRHGEISRAMRNRGIEIHVDSMDLEDLNLVDTRSLLTSVGVADLCHQQQLLRVHSAVCEHLPGRLDRPGQSALLRAGFLLREQLVRGFPFEDVFTRTCHEVYIRPHPTAFKTTSINELLQKHAECLQATNATEPVDVEMDLDAENVTKIQDEDVPNIFPYDIATLKTSKLQENSEFAVLKQQGTLLVSVLKALNDPAMSKTMTTQFLNNLSAPSLTHVDCPLLLDISLAEVIKPLLTAFYSMSSYHDVKLRHEWLQHVAEECASDDLIGFLVELSHVQMWTVSMYRETRSPESLEGSVEFPWDSRWLHALSSDILNSSPNKLFLLLEMFSRFEIERRSRTSGGFTVLKISESYKKGQSSESLKYQPIVSKFSDLVSRLRSCLRKCLTVDALPIDDKRWAALYHGLFWFFELLAQGQLQVVKKMDRKTVVNDETVAVLTVHFKWMKKHFWTMLSELLQHEELSKSKAVVAAMETLSAVESSLPQATLPLLKIGKQMRRELGQPLPFRTEEESTLFDALTKFSRAVSVWEPNSKVAGLLAKSVTNFRLKLIQFCSLLMKGVVTSQVSEVNHELETIYGTLFSPVSQEASALTTRQVAFRNARVQLWPLQEMIAVAVGCRSRRLLLEGLVSEHVDAPATDLSSTLAMLVTVPAELVAGLRLCNEHGDAFDKSIVSRVSTMLLRHCTLSPAVMNARAWSTWEHGLSAETLEVKEESYPLHCPLLSKLVMDLTLSTEDRVTPSTEDGTAKSSESPSNMATLGAHEARKQQLSVVQQLLWRNTLGLAADQFNFIKNDAASAQAAYKRFLNSLSVVLDKLVVSSDVEHRDVSVSRLVDQLGVYEGKFRRGAASLHSFKECLLQLDIDMAELGSVSDDLGSVRALTLLGKAWLKMGYLETAMFSHVGKMDPIVKRQMKLSCARKELDELRKTLYAYELQARLAGFSLDSADQSSIHPFISELQTKVQSLRRHEEELQQFIAYRSKDKTICDLNQVVLHYAGTLASEEVVFSLEKRLAASIENESDVSSAEQLLTKVMNWQQSQNWFHQNLLKEYSMFPDMVQPLLSAVAKLCYGVSLLSSTLRKVLTRKQLAVRERAVEKLVLFPSESLLDLIDNNVSSEISHVLQKSLDSEMSAQKNYRMITCSLEDLRNYIIIHGEFTKRSWDQLNSLLDKIVTAWKDQERAKEEAKIIEDSLFITKTRCENLSGDGMDLEMQEMFPSTSDMDFGDLELTPSLEARPEVLDTSSSNPLITDEDITAVCTLHSEIIQLATRTRWLKPGKDSVVPRTDYVSPFIERLKTFQCIMKQMSRGFDSSLDLRLLPGLSVLTAATLSATDGVPLTIRDHPTGSPVRHTPKIDTYDFYRDARVDEVKECLPMLNNLMLRVQQLLNEWPEHPTLNQIMAIVNRILGFSVVSPVSRFLTGLEILLTKLQEWEENAHKGVSLLTEMQALTHQIIAWRKLELNVWKDFLTNTANKVKARASKWWFHIYSLTYSFINSQTGVNEIDPKSLINALESFIKVSTLGEFEARLDLLYTFHCHTIHLEPSVNRNELLSILWNLHSYYSQFCGSVSQKIAQLRAPIEKKLKDFVKIARWNDISYWSIKETVDKTHRTLLKHIKEFEGILKQPVASCLLTINEEASSVSDGVIPARALRNQPKHYFVPTEFIAATSLKELITKNEGVPSDLLDHMPMFFSKSRKLCKEAILATSYPLLIQSVDGLVTEVIDTANHLRNLEVSSELPKEKQKSQAKSFLQQKRKALADLFKTLQNLGLSFRTGLAEWAVNDSVNVWTLPPIDIKAALHHVKTRRADYQLLSVWEGAEDYFWKFSARLCLLNAAMTTPSQELGPQNLERMKGFSVHLMRIAQKQKLDVFTTSENLFELRHQISQLQSLDDSETSLPTQAKIQRWFHRLHTLLISSLLSLEQFLLVVMSCPSPLLSSEDLDFDIPVLQYDRGGKVPQFVNACKGDAISESVAHKTRHMISTLHKIKNTLEKVSRKKFSSFSAHTVVGEVSGLDTNNLMSPAQFTFLVDSFAQLESVSNELKEVRAFFEDTRPALQCLSDDMSAMEITVDSSAVNVESPRNPMVDSIRSLEMSLTTAAAEFKSELMAPPSDRMAVTPVSVENFKHETEKMMQAVLFAIQKIYKKYSANNDADKPEGGEKEEEETENPIEDNHLQEKILASLEKDLDDLAMREVNKKLALLTRTLVELLNSENHSTDADICKRLLLRCVPCLDQLTLLGQFLLTQQVAAFRVSSKLLSVLLSIFLNLTAKGFCIPSNLLPEEGGESQQAGGMGLGEGEGEKDVSDRIESEDQLEDARPQGEERKDDDKDYKEEEKGIEMSEDFGGKAQEIEKDEEEDESGPEEEEPDKEMGETEEGADRLDQQIWGEDSESEDEEEGEGDEKEGEEEKGSGEKTDENELTAKDNKSKPGEEDIGEGKEEDEEKKKKKEINEMEEPEQDDDHIDPYHGKHAPEQEPEDLDLPDDLQLDDGEAKDGEEGEENPFDIDEMKEQQVPEEEEPEADPNAAEKPEPEKPEDSSDEEGGDLDHKNDEPMETEEAEKKEEEESGGKMGEEEKEPEASKEEEEKARPSEDSPSTDPVQAAEQMEVDGSKDQVMSQEQQKQASAQQAPEETTETPSQNEKDGVGQAEAEEQKSGHEGKLSANQNTSHDKQKAPQQEKKRKPGKSDSSRSLGDVNEPKNKKLKTVERKDDNQGEEESEEEGDKSEERGEKSDVYQHIRDAKETFDAQTLDAATKEQAEEQPVPNVEGEEADEAKEDDDVEMEDEVPETDDTIPKQEAESVEQESKRSKTDKKPTSGETDKENADMEVEVEGETVNTMTVERGAETTFHTIFGEISKQYEPVDASAEQRLQDMRQELETQLANWTQVPPTQEAEKAWELFSAVTEDLARNLSEQLRLVLEPTQASRLRGDYRTGRRINMRKVIPYIASHFRKDKIWLRRTKPSKREYQIVLAIDDSSSMADNHSKELAFESLAVVSKALTLLEAGELAVVSFGETPKVVHQLGEPFTEHCGARLLQQFSFSQQQTRVGQLVDFVSSLLNLSSSSRTAERSQLLVIVSDGRGVFSEGKVEVIQAIRQAKLAGLFMVFVIVDNPETKNSVLDIRVPKFCAGGVTLESYLDSFPFPFYLILRDINALPAVLSEALRQWFELVTNMDLK